MSKEDLVQIHLYDVAIEDYSPEELSELEEVGFAYVSYDAIDENQHELAANLFEIYNEENGTNVIRWLWSDLDEERDAEAQFLNWLLG